MGLWNYYKSGPINMILVLFFLSSVLDVIHFHYMKKSGQDFDLKLEMNT